MSGAKKRSIGLAQHLTERSLNAINRFLHIEAVSGGILLLAAVIALFWANLAPISESYHHFWHTQVSFNFGDYSFSQSLHFIINDILMTIFFLVVGMEIKKEIHDGALSNIKAAILPIVAALGGVLVPILIYLALASDEIRAGWAIPAATDIAFAVGLLALLGKSIPTSARIFLLTLAIIDDLLAILIIAFFFSGGLEVTGFVIAFIGVLGVLALQKMGIFSAIAYVFPGALIWFGLLKTGAHPTLAGVILGLMTPVLTRPNEVDAIERANAAIARLRDRDLEHSSAEIKALALAKREILPPVIRVRDLLHPWVAFIIMPIFALANAGVNFGNVNFEDALALNTILAVSIALVVGKPLGIVAFTWVFSKLGWGQLPNDLTIKWVLLIGLLAGIGFTMSIFIGNLAFVNEPNVLEAAKLGILLGSGSAAVIGLLLGFIFLKSQKKHQN
ncbi:MAG: Na+/H+ antiporter NhaA [Pseudomonadales bacterium RIFCSPHIGHO2_12_FULL_40_16]|nr:MAG: Na+/H+ antiporter NhaA [Pseudomonadales bacterium RIFCSPHIGHO2_12_FULL_40_16]